MSNNETEISDSPVSGRNWSKHMVHLAIIATIILGIMILVLATVGPAVGNVFSNTMCGL